MGNILVLGAGGFIGHNLVDELVKKHTVIGYDIQESSSMVHSGYTYIQGDFAKEERFESIFESYKIDTVYHLISTSVPRDNTERIIEEVTENILPTLRVLEAMKNKGVMKIIFISSGGTVYGEGTGDGNLEDATLNPICSYGIQKLSIEMYLNLYRHMYGINTITIRLANPYGVLKEQGRTQGLIPILLGKLYHNENIVLFGNTTRDYIYIDDAIDAIIKVYDYTGVMNVFNIGSGIPVSLQEVVEKIEHVANKQFSCIEKRPIRNCDVQNNFLDITRAEQELNWQPKVNLEEGILKTINKKGYNK